LNSVDKKELNDYDIEIIEKEKTLKECQIKNNIKSCLKCDKIIGCAIRNEYVKAVYNSMNKGQSGGFEF